MPISVTPTTLHCQEKSPTSSTAPISNPLVKSIISVNNQPGSLINISGQAEETAPPCFSGKHTNFLAPDLQVSDERFKTAPCCEEDRKYNYAQSPTNTIMLSVSYKGEEQKTAPLTQTDNFDVNDVRDNTNTFKRMDEIFAFLKTNYLKEAQEFRLRGYNRPQTDVAMPSSSHKTEKKAAPLTHNNHVGTDKIGEQDKPGKYFSHGRTKKSLSLNKQNETRDAVDKEQPCSAGRVASLKQKLLNKSTDVYWQYRIFTDQANTKLLGAGRYIPLCQKPELITALPSAVRSVLWLWQQLAFELQRAAGTLLCNVAELKKINTAFTCAEPTAEAVSVCRPDEAAGGHGKAKPMTQEDDIINKVALLRTLLDNDIAAANAVIECIGRTQKDIENQLSKKLRNMVDFRFPIKAADKVQVILPEIAADFKGIVNTLEQAIAAAGASLPDFSAAKTSARHGLLEATALINKLSKESTSLIGRPLDPYSRSSFLARRWAQVAADHAPLGSLTPSEVLVLLKKHGMTDEVLSSGDPEGYLFATRLATELENARLGRLVLPMSAEQYVAMQKDMTEFIVKWAQCQSTRGIARLGFSTVFSGVEFFFSLGTALPLKIGWTLVKGLIKTPYKLYGVNKHIAPGEDINYEALHDMLYIQLKQMLFKLPMSAMPGCVKSIAGAAIVTGAMARNRILEKTENTVTAVHERLVEGGKSRQTKMSSSWNEAVGLGMDVGFYGLQYGTNSITKPSAIDKTTGSLLNENRETLGHLADNDSGNSFLVNASTDLQQDPKPARRVQRSATPDTDSTSLPAPHEASESSGSMDLLGLTTSVTKAFPDVRKLASDLLMEHIREKSGLRIDPDNVYLHRFKNAQEGDSPTGWVHSGQPELSRTLTQVALDNFPAHHWNDPSVANMWCGIYSDPADPTDNYQFNGKKQLPLKPSMLARIIWDMDYYNKYINAVNYFWSQHSESYKLLLHNTMLSDLKKSADSLPEKAVDVVLNALRPSEQDKITLQLLDINGYKSTDMMIIRSKDKSSIVLYTPRNATKFHSFNHLEQLRSWVVQECSTQQGRAGIGAYFAIKERMDGPTFLGKWGVNKWLDNISDFKSRIAIDSSSYQGSVVEIISATRHHRMLDDGDNLIKSDSEVRRDEYIDALHALNSLFPEPVTQVIATGLDIVRAKTADNEAERDEAVADIKNDAIQLAIQTSMGALSKMPLSSESVGAGSYRIPTYAEYSRQAMENTRPTAFFRLPQRLENGRTGYPMSPTLPPKIPDEATRPTLQKAEHAGPSQSEGTMHIPPETPSVLSGTRPDNIAIPSNPPLDSITSSLQGVDAEENIPELSTRNRNFKEPQSSVIVVPDLSPSLHEVDEGIGNLFIKSSHEMSQAGRSQPESELAIAVFLKKYENRKWFSFESHERNDVIRAIDDGKVTAKKMSEQLEVPEDILHSWLDRRISMRERANKLLSKYRNRKWHGLTDEQKRKILSLIHRRLVPQKDVAIRLDIKMDVLNKELIEIGFKKDGKKFIAHPQMKDNEFLAKCKGRKWKDLTSGERNRIAKIVSKGKMGLAPAAKKFNIDKKTIRMKIKRLGLTLVKRRDAIKAAINSGESESSVRRKYRLSPAYFKSSDTPKNVESPVPEQGGATTSSKFIDIENTHVNDNNRIASMSRPTKNYKNGKELESFIRNLKAANITSIISLDDGMGATSSDVLRKRLNENNINYLSGKKTWIKDFFEYAKKTQPTPKEIDIITEVVASEMSKSKDGIVAVHCALGDGRSGMIKAAYIMKAEEKAGAFSHIGDKTYEILPSIKNREPVSSYKIVYDIMREVRKNHPKAVEREDDIKVLNDYAEYLHQLALNRVRPTLSH